MATKQGFKRWFEPIKLRVQVAVQRVHDEVIAALGTNRERVLQSEGVDRKVWFVGGTDDRSFMKSLGSIRSKLGRKLCELETKNSLPSGRMSCDEVEELLFSFPDLGRFRVVFDLSQDVMDAWDVLVTPPEKALLGLFPIRKNKDFVYDIELRRLFRGHRARQLTVDVVQDNRTIQVEIQLMTLLQNVWDQRNHPLYEWEREGGCLPPQLLVNDIALAETLHLVDEQATRNWREFLKIRKESP